MTLRRFSKFAATFAALVSVTGFAAYAITPTGTTINATASAAYSDTAGKAMPAATSNTVGVKVGQVGGVGVAGATTLSVPVGKTDGAPFTVTNKGNGSDTFSLAVASSNTAVQTRIVKDANGDGVLQSTETTAASSTGSLALGASEKFLAVVSTADNTLSGQTATVTVTAKSTFDSTKTAAANVTVTFAVPTEKFVRNWLVNGYYANTDKATRLSKDYLGVESLSAPVEGAIEGGKAWMLYQSPTDNLDFSKVYGGVQYCAGYACVYIDSPIAGNALLKMGSDDGVKAWLNGQVVWTNDTFRDCIADTDSAAIALKQGINRLLVKVSQDSAGWSLCARISDTAGNNIPGLTYTTEVADTTAPVLSNVKVTSVSTTEATIEWDTNEEATTEVGYGVTNITERAYGDPALTTHHSAKLTGLQANTTYKYKAYSADVQNNIGSSNDLVFQTTANPQPQPTSNFITTWVVNGIYSNSDKATRLSKIYLPSETSIYPYTGFVTNSKSWIRATAASTGKVDLAAQYNNATNCAAYAHVYFYSAVTQNAYLLMGSDDGIKVWLNGKNIWTNDVYRGFTADQDRVAVTLGAGWHRMLVKLSQGSSGWGFGARFVDANGNPAQGLTFQVDKPW